MKKTIAPLSPRKLAVEDRDAMIEDSRFGSRLFILDPRP